MDICEECKKELDPKNTWGFETYFNIGTYHSYCSKEHTNIGIDKLKKLGYKICTSLILDV